MKHFPCFLATQWQFSHVCLSSWWEVPFISLTFAQNQALILHVGQSGIQQFNT